MIRRDVLALAAIALVSAAYTIGFVWRVAATEIGIPNYDTYALYYPNLLYALSAIGRGEGVWWNPFQNCGQPFFAIAATGILYPPHAVYLVLEPHQGMLVLAGIHFFLAGLLAYVFFREIDLTASAAFAGAVAFELGGMTVFLAFWSPTLVGHYLWVPAAMAACERILRRPTWSAALVLGLVLSVQFLAGYPPMTFFTYQLIGLRLLWELVARKGWTRPRALLLVGVGLVVPVGLIAVQLFPSLELAAESLRSRPLTEAEIRPAAHRVTWEGFRKTIGPGASYGSVLALIPMALAAVGLAARHTRSQAAFYLLVGLLYAALAFENPLLALYQKLPLGMMFRMPWRFLWLTGFAACALVALGTDALVRGGDGVRRPLAVLAAMAAGLTAVVLVDAGGFRARDWILAALTVGVGALAACTARGRTVAAAALPVLVLAAYAVRAASPHSGYLSDDRMLFELRPVFARLRERMTVQERMFHSSVPRHYGLQRKSPSIFRLPSITDYETQASRRYTELYVRMIHDRPMQKLDDFYFQLSEIPRNRPLFNLLAARYVVLRTTRPFFWPAAFRDLRRLESIGDATIFENRQALPRAFFVPRVEVAERSAVLERLASPSHDPRRVALVEEPPLGEGGLPAGAPATGEAQIVADRAEELVVRVRASGAGFLFVADQLYPGWEATVNGAPTAIARANYAFRLVRVPAGESVVVLRYRPLSVRLGAWVSIATALLVAAFFLVRFALWVFPRRSVRP